MKFAQNLKKHREQRGVSRVELAGVLGSIYPDVIARYERGENMPSVGVLWTLCKALDVTPNDLLGWDE